MIYSNQIAFMWPIMIKIFNNFNHCRGNNIAQELPKIIKNIKVNFKMKINNSKLDSSKIERHKVI